MSNGVNMNIVLDVNTYTDIYNIKLKCKPTPEIIEQLFDICDIPFKCAFIEKRPSGDVFVYKCSFNDIISDTCNSYIYKDGKLYKQFTIGRPNNVDNINRKFKLSFEDIANYGLKELIEQSVRHYEINDKVIIAFDHISFESKYVQFKLFLQVYNSLLDFIIDSNHNIVNDYLYNWFSNEHGDLIINTHNEYISLIEWICKNYENIDESVFDFNFNEDIITYFDINDVYNYLFRGFSLNIYYQNDSINTSRFVDFLHQLGVLKSFMSNYDKHKKLYTLSVI